MHSSPTSPNTSSRPTATARCLIALTVLMVAPLSGCLYAVAGAVEANRQRENDARLAASHKQDAERAEQLRAQMYYDLRRRAAFDFQCPEEQLHLNPLSANPAGYTTSYAVDGCGKQAAYVYSPAGAWAMEPEVPPPGAQSAEVMPPPPPPAAQ
jgi:hypothetical protein